MRRFATTAFAALLLGVFPALAQAAPPAGDTSLTILFTGDNGGEVAPCG